MIKLGRTAALAAFAAILVVSGMAVQHASADEPHDGLQFSIGVRGVAGCNTRESDVTCSLPAGQPFVVEVALDALPDDIPSYGGFDLYVEFGGVTPSDDASNIDWPNCGFPAAFVGDGFVGWGCAMGAPPSGPSSWVGPIGTVTFTCTQDGSISLIHGSGSKTDLLNPLGDVKHSEGVNVSETLAITCGTIPAGTPGQVTEGTPGGPGPTPHEVHPEITGPDPTPGPTLEPTAAAQATATALAMGTATPEPTTGGPTGDGDDDDDSMAWIWIVVIVAAVAAVGIAGGGYWWMRRSRSDGTGGGPPTSGSGVPSGGPPTSGAGSAGATPGSGGGSTAT